MCLSYDSNHVAHSDLPRCPPDHFNDESEHPIDHFNKGDDGNPCEQAQCAADCSYLVEDIHPGEPVDQG